MSVSSVMAALRRMENGITLTLKDGRGPWFTDMLYPAGVLLATWTLPTCDVQYITTTDVVNIDGIPLSKRCCRAPELNEKALYLALVDGGLSSVSFQKFLETMWAVGVVSFSVDMVSRTVTCHGPDIRTAQGGMTTIRSVDA